MEFLSPSMACSMAFWSIQSITWSFNLCKSLVIFELPSSSWPTVGRLVVFQITDIQKQHQSRESFLLGNSFKSGVHPIEAGPPADAIRDALQKFSFPFFLFINIWNFVMSLHCFLHQGFMSLCLKHQVLQKKLQHVLLHMHFARVIRYYFSGMRVGQYIIIIYIGYLGFIHFFGL